MIVIVFAKCAVHGCSNKRSPRHRFPNPSIRPASFRAWVAACANEVTQKNPQLLHKNHRVCHVQFYGEDRASKSYLKKNAVPSLFLPVPTVDGRENVSDHEHCTIVAESNAPTPDPNGVNRSTCNMSNKSKRGEAVVWESFCEAATSVATSIDCCKTSVQVTHGMVSDSSIILLEVLIFLIFDQ
ncbi:hypothetical protein Trydic_g12912 [Trypoxylus dichotomus]